MSLELLPGRQAAGIGAVDDQHAVEVVDLVLEGPGGEALPAPRALLALAVEIAHPDREMALDIAAQVRDREAALVDQQVSSPSGSTAGLTITVSGIGGLYG